MEVIRVATVNFEAGFDFKEVNSGFLFARGN